MFVRRDVERRLLDRMEGAAGATPGRSAAVSAALLVGFDFAVRQNVPQPLGEPPNGSTDDPLVDFLAALCHPTPPPVGQVIAAGWRAALLSVAAGTPAEQAREALRAVELRLDR